MCCQIRLALVVIVHHLSSQNPEMHIYIRGSSVISPQKTFRSSTLSIEAVEYSGNRLGCIEPDYKEIIDGKFIRRMSRIIRMGVTSAMECLKDARLHQPDAIITGTAYGCLEDTFVFLKKMVENKEEMLSPSAFIQSTHNTIGAQISLMLKCNNYNNTFTNCGFSFESALLDSMMLLKDKDANDVLVGGIDEITDTSYAVLSRFGLYKKGDVSNRRLFNYYTKGTIAGEGAAYFVLSNRAVESNIARLDAMITFYKPKDNSIIEQNILAFLDNQKIKTDEIDLVITGRNGDLKGDNIYDKINTNVFKKNTIINYKHLCGEYPTSVAFAMWLACHSLKNGLIPFHENIKITTKIKKILIYNNYMGIHHSLLLFSAC